MEHIVRSLNKAPELTDYVSEGYEDSDEAEGQELHINGDGLRIPTKECSGKVTANADAPGSPAYSSDGHSDDEDVNPDMESRFFNNPDKNKRLSSMSMTDVADRHLRDKTDAIADIIRNISDQCAAAVEGLQLAHDAEEDEEHPTRNLRDNATVSEDGQDHSVRTDGSEFGEDLGPANSRLLTPEPKRGSSSIPPTPDLVHGNRSSTSMSINSQSTAPERGSNQYHGADVRTKIVSVDDPSERGSESGHTENDNAPLAKHAGAGIVRPATAKISS